MQREVYRRVFLVCVVTVCVLILAFVTVVSAQNREPIVSQDECAILGPDEVCPGSTNQYCGPPGHILYEWSISGNGTILTHPESECVDVQADGVCGLSYTLTLWTVGSGGTIPLICHKAVAVDDTQSPTNVVCPGPVSVQCPGDVPAPNIALVTASDNCGTPVITYIGDNSDGNTCPEVITRTYRATDACGNFTDCQQLITVDDTQSPTNVVCPGPVSVQCPGDVPAPNTALVSATDNCSVPVITYIGDSSDGNTCPELITRTYRATDACGNFTDCQQLITVDDTQAPTNVVCPGPVSVQCPGDIPAPNIALVTASDNCGTPVITHVDDVPDGNTCPKVITRTYRATDACGNFTDCQQLITVNDGQAPTNVVCPGPVSVQCPADVPAPNTALVTASDNCGTPVITHVGDVSDGNTCPEVITRTYRATDACGNFAECEQLITVNDTQAPVLICEPDGEVGCGETVIFTDPAISDNCDPSPVLTVVSVSSVPGPGTGETTHKKCWEATDECGNVSVGCCQTIIERCGLTLDKVDDISGCVGPGANITYTITYGNPSTSGVTGVVITDQAPLETSFISATDGGVYNPLEHEVIWNIGAVAGESGGDVELVVQTDPGIPFGITLIDTCKIDSDQTEPTEVTKITQVCAGCLDLWLDDLMANPGDNILVPVYIDDVTGAEIWSFDMEICWCDVPAGLLAYEYCVPGEVMTGSGWGDPVCNECGPNCVSISAAGTNPLESGGVLFYLKFAVSTNAKPCTCCDMWFTGVNMYDENENPLYVCWEDGSICIESCDIEGLVNYWRCCYDDCDEPYFVTQIADAFMHVTDCNGEHFASQYTDANGHYLFDCLAPLADDCFYCIDVSHCPILPCVTSMDAALALQNVVCLDDLDDCPFPYDGGMVYPQQVAADVNCSGRVTSVDAAYILQYAVGLTNIFPCPSTWKFYPLGDNCIAECPGTMDWVGVFYGDVTGCPPCPPSDFMALPPLETRVWLANETHYDNKVDLTIRTRAASDVIAIDMLINYNAADFTVHEVQAVGLGSGFATDYNPLSNPLDIGMARATGVGGKGALAKITLIKKHQPIPSTQGRVSIAEATFNDVPIVIEGQPAERRMELALGPIAPNPFVDGTTVRFTMASTAEVNLSIYSVSGQLVTTLVDGMVPAGQQNVTWDGTDRTGDKVNRGVYFCRMVTDGFVTSRKLVMLE